MESMGIRVGALVLWLWALALLCSCQRRALREADARWLEQKPFVAPRAGPAVQVSLRFLPAQLRGTRKHLEVEALLARPLLQGKKLSQREPAPADRLVDPSDLLLGRFLQQMRARGLAASAKEACAEQAACPPELLLEATTEQAEVSLLERSFGAILPVFRASLLLTDPSERVLWSATCELGLSPRPPFRQPPLAEQLQRLLDTAARTCAGRMFLELEAAVEGRPPGRAPPADED